MELNCPRLRMQTKGKLRHTALPTERSLCPPKMLCGSVARQNLLFKRIATALESL